MLYCKKCGGSVSQGEAYCRTCGNRVSEPKHIHAPELPRRSRLVAGLLGIFAGCWGIHNFYLRRIGRGILQIVLTAITFGFAGLWGFVEGVLLLCDKITTDGKGIPLSE